MFGAKLQVKLVGPCRSGRSVNDQDSWNRMHSWKITCISICKLNILTTELQVNIYEHMLLSFEQNKYWVLAIYFVGFFQFSTLEKTKHTSSTAHGLGPTACGLRQVLEHLPKIATLDGELLTGDDDEAPFGKRRFAENSWIYPPWN